MIPNRKISETILEFGDPILEELPENASKEEMEAAMRLIVSAWNAVVLDDWNKTREFEKAFLKALIVSVPPGISPLVDRAWNGNRCSCHTTVAAISWISSARRLRWSRSWNRNG